MSQAILTEDRSKCANPFCEHLLEGNEARCPKCGEPQFYCRQCGASARALAAYCRCCAARLETDWAHEQRGLKYSPPARVAMDKSGKMRLDWQLSLGVEMVAVPLATRGIVVLTLADG